MENVSTESNCFGFEILQGCCGIVCSRCQFIWISYSSPKYSAIAFVAAYVSPCFVFRFMQAPDHYIATWTRTTCELGGGSNRVNHMLCWPLFLPDSWFHLRFSSCRTSRYETLDLNHIVHTLSSYMCLRFFTGAFFNGVFLLALALSICLQSIERFINIQPVDSPLLVLIMACTGLGLNILSAFVVHGMFLIMLFMGNFRFNSEYIFRPSWS
jgi:hypothetical protein